MYDGFNVLFLSDQQLELQRRPAVVLFDLGEFFGSFPDKTVKRTLQGFQDRIRADRNAGGRFGLQAVVHVAQRPVRLKEAECKSRRRQQGDDSAGNCGGLRTDSDAKTACGYTAGNYCRYC